MYDTNILKEIWLRITTAIGIFGLGLRIDYNLSEVNKDSAIFKVTFLSKKYSLFLIEKALMNISNKLKLNFSNECLKVDATEYYDELLSIKQNDELLKKNSSDKVVTHYWNTPSLGSPVVEKERKKKKFSPRKRLGNFLEKLNDALPEGAIVKTSLNFMCSNNTRDIEIIFDEESDLLSFTKNLRKGWVFEVNGLLIKLKMTDQQIRKIVYSNQEILKDKKSVTKKSNISTKIRKERKDKGQVRKIRPEKPQVNDGLKIRKVRKDRGQVRKPRPEKIKKVKVSTKKAKTIALNYNDVISVIIQNTKLTRDNIVISSNRNDVGQLVITITEKND